ncbi:MAG: TolC family protein [Thermoanaerobaculia bacterium]|jgi:cobalt-zinc-cadmium efflux system outer membrane protein|nr:TolC family protein [Thermoanaerobaculia bacterium]MBP7813368.1 TolC family protein [Thermoanaerobaculia bacterium]MBP8846072.1 TolC family protein [Thermoanaerobaculia bacterium]
MRHHVTTLSLTLFLLAGAAGAEAPPPLTLARALEIARAGNEVGAIAAARLERAEAARHLAISQLVPGLSLTSVYTRRAREVSRRVGDDNVTIQARDALNGTLVLDSVLFDARSIPGIRAASRALAAQRFDSTELERALAFEVGTTFLAVLSAERLHEAAARRVEVATRTAEDARIRLDAGLAARNELTRSELELASARLAETQATNAVRTTRLALGLLLATPVEGPLVEPEPFAEPGRDASALAERAIASSGELRALAERVEAARQRALVPALGFVPTLDLRAIYRGTNEAGLSGRERDWSAAITLGWSLFDGGRRRAERVMAEADLHEAELTLARRCREVAAAVERALSDLETAGAALAQAEVRAEVARQNAEEVGERFAQGLASGLEQADALVSRFEAEAELARQGFALHVSQLQLLQALGEWPLSSSPSEPSAPEVAS